MSWAWGDRSLEHRARLHPDLQALVDEVLRIVPFDVALTDSFRGMAEQMAAFADGATKVRWPDGKHNREPSWAVHIDPYPINYSNDLLYYTLAGVVMTAARELGMQERVRWGGDWNGNLDLNEETFRDLAHWELRAEGSITRKGKEMGGIINLSAIFGDKAWFQSMTAWGLILLTVGGSAVDELCAAGIMGAAVCVTAKGWVLKIGVVLAGLGIRRAGNPAAAPVEAAA